MKTLPFKRSVYVRDVSPGALGDLGWFGQDIAKAIGSGAKTVGGGVSSFWGGLTGQKAQANAQAAVLEQTRIDAESDAARTKALLGFATKALLVGGGLFAVGFAVKAFKK